MKYNPRLDSGFLVSVILLIFGCFILAGAYLFLF